LAKQFQRRRLLEIGQSETRIVCGEHVCQQIEMKCAIVIEDLPLLIPSKFRFILQSSLRGEDFIKSVNQKQETLVATMFVNGSGRNE
jgi:hypothetical protein